MQKLRRTDTFGFFCTTAFLTLASIVQQTAYSAEKLTLASPFSDHMVLQRDQEVRIFGTADPKSHVTVSINGQTANATADATGKFIATLKPLTAGGPFDLDVHSGSESAAMHDVLVGDVWLCSGQSNMQMSLKEVINAPAEIATAASHPQLRFLTVAKAGSDVPQTQFKGEWKTCSPQVAENFSAVGYFFAHELYKSPKLANVPIGLIDSSFGGTVVEGWIPAKKLEGFPQSEMRSSMFGIKSSALYNAMIAPLAPLNLKGAIWYQGEGNASYPQPYAKLLAILVEDWRQEFKSPQLPFFIVELPPNNGDWGGYYFTWLREMQRQVAATVPHVDLATTVNTHDGTDLHPKEKHEIGTRLALLARHDVYGEEIVARGPVYKSAQVDGSTLRVTFETNGSPLAARQQGPLRGFELAGSDGNYRFAEAKIDGPDTVVVQSDLVPEPKTVRYAFEPVPQADLYNAAGLPAGPFRTDDAPVAPLVEVLPQPQPRRVTTPAYEVDISGGGKITDLIANGEQFVSNASGGNGGSSIPNWFGFRDLRDVRELGPGSITFFDNEVSLMMNFEAAKMHWQIENKGDEKSFRLALAPQVTVDKRGNELQLKRGKSSVEVSGFNVINQTSEGGKLLEVKLPAKGSVNIDIVVHESPH